MLETVEDLSGEELALELPMFRCVSNFHTATLALPIPGAIGTEAGVYLAVLEMQGLAPSSRYEGRGEMVTGPDL